MSYLLLKVVGCLLLMGAGRGMIYRFVDRVWLSAVDNPSKTGKDVCRLVASTLVLNYIGVLIWLFFIH